MDRIIWKMFLNGLLTSLDCFASGLGIGRSETDYYYSFTHDLHPFREFPDIYR